MKKAPNIKLSIIDLEEIPDRIDISINLPEKKLPEPIYDTKKQEKTNSIQLF